MSDNPIVPPIETTAEELRVIGRVIWVGRRM
jgi:phage repressor protein C with HTH and peptisase S24 domain